MDEDERYDKQIEKRIEKLEKDVDSLKLWRAFVLGCAAPLAFLLGAFSHELALFLRAHA